LTVLYVALRCWNLTAYGLWTDEVFSVQASRLAWSHLFTFVAADSVHPPLFYVLLKLWMTIGGTTLLWIKLLPLILSVLALVPFYLLCRELKLDPVATAITLWLIAINEYLIQYSQELRMYSLLFCLALWSLWLVLRLVGDSTMSRRHLLPLFTLNLLLVYTHYFAWLLVGVEWLYVLVYQRRQIVPFSLLVGALVLCFCPWAYAVKLATDKTNLVPATLQWIGRPGWADFAWYFATLNGIIPLRHTTPLGILLFGSPIALTAFRILCGRGSQTVSSRRFIALCLFSFLPVALAYAASQLLSQSVWGARHLVIAAIPYFVLVVAALSELRPVSMRVVAITAVVAWAGVAAVAAVRQNDNHLAWKTLVRDLRDREGSLQRTVPIYALDAWVAPPLQFLLSDLGNEHFEVLVSELDLVDGGHFWIAFRDTTWRQADQPREVLERRGCRVEAELSVRDRSQRVFLLSVDC
jgi:hypothetical protein